MNPRQGVAILGATGSIGANTLEVLALHPNRYRVVAVSAYSQVERLFAQCLRFEPALAVMVEPAAAEHLMRRVREAGLATEVVSGREALSEMVARADVEVVMAAIVGAAGLLPTLQAVRAGKRVLLANKEPLVMSGPLLLREARASGALLLPIDSEHNAVFQCMPEGGKVAGVASGVRRILLTCSGGPFRTTPREQLADVTPEQACAHPKWAMGRKISVDSATLMNKGLEVIEACLLFDALPSQVDVVVHPQSVIHSMVEYVDGAVLAQMSHPDMRVPIAHALAWPGRIPSGVASLDFAHLARLDFEAPDTVRFPALALAYDAARAGGTAPTVLNAANEIAVQAFLEGRIRFDLIPDVIERCLSLSSPRRNDSLEIVLAEDARARALAEDAVARHDRAKRRTGA